MAAKRSEVYKVINGEREYQNKWAGERQRTITEFLTYVQDYTDEALHILCREAFETAEPKALHTVRKIAALAVACMEDHGAPPRDGFTGDPTPPPAGSEGFFGTDGAGI